VSGVTAPQHVTDPRRLAWLGGTCSLRTHSAHSHRRHTRGPHVRRGDCALSPWAEGRGSGAPTLGLAFRFRRGTLLSGVPRPAGRALKTDALPHVTREKERRPPRGPPAPRHGPQGHSPHALIGDRGSGFPVRLPAFGFGVRAGRHPSIAGPGDEPPPPRGKCAAKLVEVSSAPASLPSYSYMLHGI
jgi:hypothetical protein